MSTGMRMSFDNAVIKAADFLNLIKPELTCERFEWAGSLRRKRADVGDFDAVAIPKIMELPTDDMFGTPKPTNLLWHRIDDLVRLGTVARHVKDTAAGPREKWGDLSRAIEFRGCCVEIQLCDVDNWGAWMVVRTGPGDLSHELVKRLPRFNYACRGGFHIWDMKAEPPRELKNLTEEQVLKMAGLPVLPPEKR